MFRGLFCPGTVLNPGEFARPHFGFHDQAGPPHAGLPGRRNRISEKYVQELDLPVHDLPPLYWVFEDEATGIN